MKNEVVNDRAIQFTASFLMDKVLIDFVLNTHYNMMKGLEEKKMMPARMYKSHADSVAQ